MKKLIYFLSFLTLVMLLACKKSHVCSCDKTINTNGVIAKYPVVDSVINNMSSKKANEICNNGDMQYTQVNETITINCELK